MTFPELTSRTSSPLESRLRSNISHLRDAQSPSVTYWSRQEIQWRKVKSTPSATSSISSAITPRMGRQPDGHPKEIQLIYPIPLPTTSSSTEENHFSVNGRHGIHVSLESFHVFPSWEEYVVEEALRRKFKPLPLLKISTGLQIFHLTPRHCQPSVGPRLHGWLPYKIGAVRKRTTVHETVHKYRNCHTTIRD